MGKRLWKLGGLLGAVFLGIAVAAAAEQNGTVFELEEVSVFEPATPGQPELPGARTTGPTVLCHALRSTEVKKCPELKSSRPLSGFFYFGANPAAGKAGICRHFVIDESQPADTQAADNRSLLQGLAAALASTPDASQADRKYDRLYFDVNGDLDLTNDPVVEPMKNSPARFNSRGYVAFDYLEVQFDHGPGLGMRPLKVLPVLRPMGFSQAYLTLTPVVARRGQIKLGDQQFTAWLTQTGMITGRFDTPYTALSLVPADPTRRILSALSGMTGLSGLHWANGKYYRISATPSGDKLTIAPYAGDTGVLKVSAGSRQGIEKLGISGRLRADQTMLPVGDTTPLIPTEKLPQHRIPVGEYTPMSLAVDFGKYALSFSANYYSKEEPHARTTTPSAAVLKIRKDQPLVLDFSHKPAVWFLSPAKEQAVKPGETVRLQAAIVEPEMNLLIRGLNDTSQVIEQREYRFPGSEPVEIPRYASLDPTVTITDAAGKQVAQGTMPFG